MNDEDANDLLVRVDQNVINLMELVKNHLNEDKDIHEKQGDRIGTLEKAQEYRRGMGRVVTLLWGFAGAVLGAKYGK